MDYKQTTKILHESSAIVSRLGDILLSDNNKLSTSLDIDDIQFWDAIAVELALYHLPKVLSSTKQNWLFARKAVSKFRTVVSGMRRRILLRRTLNDHKDWPKQPILFLGFSDYIYRDTLKSVVERMKTKSDVRICAIHSDRGCKKSDESLFPNGIRTCISLVSRNMTNIGFLRKLENALPLSVCPNRKHRPTSFGTGVNLVC
jgi:hypothetical protein